MGQYNDAINTYEHLMSEMKENGNYDVGKNVHVHVHVHVHACMCCVHVHVHVPDIATCTCIDTERVFHKAYATTYIVHVHVSA